MKLTRRDTRNLEFDLSGVTKNPDGSRLWATESMHAAILMDIRDELHQLNSLLGCRNFTSLPQVMKRIDRRLAKKISLKP